MSIIRYRSPDIKTASDIMNGIWVEKSINFLSDVINDNCIVSSPIKDTMGSQSLQKILKSWFRAFPDLTYKQRKVQVHNKLVSIEWECSGNNLGDFFNYPATGQNVKYHGTTQFSISNDDRICRYSSNVNMNDFINHMGFNLENGVSNDKDSLIDNFERIQNQSFSKRQVECLSLITIGFTTKAVSAKLGIQTSSVNKNLERAFSKLGISNRQMFLSKMADEHMMEILTRIAHDIHWDYQL